MSGVKESPACLCPDFGVIKINSDSLRASKIMQDRAFNDPKLNIVWNTEVVDVLGDQKVSGLALKDTVTGEERNLDVTGLFVAIGHDPRSELVKGQVDLDAEGYVVVDGRSTRVVHDGIALPGVFAAGDLVDHTYRQAITAAKDKNRLRRAERREGAMFQFMRERHEARLAKQVCAAKSCVLRIVIGRHFASFNLSAAGNCASVATYRKCLVQPWPAARPA